jgi:hypothetical protein
MPCTRLVSAQESPKEDVFDGDERHLRAASSRHAAIARMLFQNPLLVGDAQFHALLATECLFKHLFCLLRFSHGLGARTPDAYGRVTPARSFQHQVKKLGTVLLQDVELQTCLPLQRLMMVIPGGVAWNEDRYRSLEGAAETVAANVEEIRNRPTNPGWRA